MENYISSGRVGRAELAEQSWQSGVGRALCVQSRVAEQSGRAEWQSRVGRALCVQSRVAEQSGRAE
jgi:hypothetical protein